MRSNSMEFSFSKTPLLDQVSKMEIHFKGVTQLEATGTADTVDKMFDDSLESFQSSLDWQLSYFSSYYNKYSFESFQGGFRPEEMRCLALVAHNHMKPAMKAFVQDRREILKKFRLTGTNTTMTMLRTIFDHDEDMTYGPSFKSGPLGGDAEVCALMCQGDLGGILFFMDPLDTHPHQCDINALIRLSNVNNILLATNPTSCYALTFLLERALKEEKKDMIPSFFHSLESPGVKVYKEGQSKHVKILAE